MNKNYFAPQSLSYAIVCVLFVGALCARVAKAHPIDEAPPPTLAVGAQTTDTTITFTVVVQDVQATEALLWYDTTRGHTLRHVPLQGNVPLQATLTITPSVEGWVLPSPQRDQLDYWWGVRDGQGQLIRVAGTVVLPPALQRAAQTPPPMLPAPFRWQEARTSHLTLRYYPNSSAARDIAQLKVVAERAWTQASATIVAPRYEPVTIYLTPRVFWQGGVTYDARNILITYSDRNYAGVDVWAYLVHELVHALSANVVRPGGEIGGLLGEGAAVQAVGGHYGVEPLHAWAATISGSERYLPFCTLRTAWDDQQHEIAYLEAGSFVDYLVQTYGRARFQTFYSNEPAPRQVRDSKAWCEHDAGRNVLGIGKPFAVLEREWRTWLTKQRATAADATTVQGQIRFYDLMRQYQEQRDPQARTLPPRPDTWGPDMQQLFASPAPTPTQVLQEALLLAADRALDQRLPGRADTMLNELERSIATNALTGTLGAAYSAINTALQQQARAVRLGDHAAYTLTTGNQVPWFATLWADYRWTINTVSVTGGLATVNATLTTQDDRGVQTVQAYEVRLRQEGVIWRIEKQQLLVPQLVPPSPYTRVA